MKHNLSHNEAQLDLEDIKHTAEIAVAYTKEALRKAEINLPDFEAPTMWDADNIERCSKHLISAITTLHYVDGAMDREVVTVVDKAHSTETIFFPKIRMIKMLRDEGLLAPDGMLIGLKQAKDIVEALIKIVEDYN